MYIIVPSLFFAAYHVPNHGPGRLLDTFLTGAAFGWLAIRYGFPAPVVLHMLLDAQAIPTWLINHLPSGGESWLAQNRWALNTSVSVLLLSLMGTAVVLIVWRMVKPPSGKFASSDDRRSSAALE